MKLIANLLVAMLLAQMSTSVLLTSKHVNNIKALALRKEAGDSEKRQVLKKIYNKLLASVIKNEGKINKFKMAFGKNDDDRHMVATDDIKADEVILRIPESMIISSRNDQLKNFCQKVRNFAEKNKLQHEPDDLCLILWISKERHNITHSKFQGFVAFLPLVLNNFPILYKANERKLFSNTYLEELIDSERDFLQSDYAKFKEKGRRFFKLTQDEFNKAYELFYSRTYQFTNDSGVNITGFVPLVDLFNYKTDLAHKLSWKFKHGAFVVYAVSDIPKGSILHIEYGTHSNVQYLTNYGFTLPNNTNKPSYNIYVGDGEKQSIVELTGEIDMMKTLEPIRRSFAKERKGGNGNNNSHPSIISQKNEVQALTALKKELDTRVKSWKTSLQQDTLRLKNAVEANEKNILRVVTEEKKIVKIYQGLCSHFINILNKRKHSVLNKTQSKLVVLNPHFRAYFSELNSRLSLDIRTQENL